MIELDLDLYHPDDSVDGKLVPIKKQGVLAVQVTKLKCGDLMIGCSIDHRVADAYSANMFFVAWAQIARGKSVSHTPIFRRSMLNPRRPGQYDKVIDDMYVFLSLLPPPPPKDLKPNEDHLISRIYYITAEEIDRLQAKASSNGSKRSKLVSFSAFLWKIMAEGGHDHSKKCKMGAKEEHFLGLIDWVELHRPEQIVAKVYFKESNDEEAVVVSSGQRFIVSEMDFGWGRPDFGSYYFPWGGQTGFVMPMPSISREGDWVVYMHLPEKHLDLVKKEASHVFRPLTPAYLKFRDDYLN
ncbi:unnamed protein product [Ilex paraguariensis]|uniref:Uncharacterized protein n=1 Tax=Ilex paraguariensis TaxID=185542 RepID=A0ABC8TQ04_9AQUA